MTRPRSACSLRALGALLTMLVLAACDAGFDGDRGVNAPPETELSVRTTDLRNDLNERRLISTVDVAWSGTDPDGVVQAYDVRSFQVDAVPGAEEGWSRTARRDSTLRLTIPQGESTADVVVEVRSVDNEGLVDPTPARTVFPIVNSNPSFRLVQAEAPPDSTWPVVSFSFAAADVDGDDNLAGIEIALNDPDGDYLRIPADITFVTLIADDPSAQTTSATLYTGRGFRNSGLTLPGLRLDGDNAVYFRAVDQAGARSPVLRYPALDADGAPAGTFYVRGVSSRVLLVNDLRGLVQPPELTVARSALAAHGTVGYDEWDLSATPQSAASPQFSDAIPSSADPTLRQTLALWDRIYWVSNAVTNRADGNNLPRAASVMDLFFDQGGRIMVQVPVTLPQGDDAGASNAAIDILPLGTLVELPAGVRGLRTDGGTPVRPQAEVPGTGQRLPQLQAARLVSTALPYTVGPDDIPLYELSFYQGGDRDDPWQGSEVVASIRSDLRSGLFALPLFAGATSLFEAAGPAGGGPEAAIAAMLDGLGFPTGSARVARR